MESRDYGVELDRLHTQMNELKQLFKSFMNESNHHRTAQHETEAARKVAADNQRDEGEAGVIFYSGHYQENKELQMGTTGKKGQSIAGSG